MIMKAKKSKGEMIWFGIIFWSVTFTAAEAPYSFTFSTKLQSWQIWSDVLISIIFTIDFIYHLREFRKKHKNKLLRNKINNKDFIYLVVDLISCIPFDLTFYLFGIGVSAGKFLKLIRLFRLIRIVKIFSVVDSLTIVPSYVKFQLVVVSSLIVIHWIACGWILLHPVYDSSQVEYYVKSFYWAVTTLTTIGYGDITPTGIVDRIYTMIIMILGVGVYGLVIGNISRIFAEAARYKEQSREKFQDLSLFMRHYHIPDRLQSAVFNYYNHLFSKRLSDNDQQIIGELPLALKQELQIYMNMKLIRNLPVFKYSSQACLKAIAASLEQNYYGPNDTIISIGELGEEMFIIGHGVIDVILKDGNVVASLHEGQFFGEAALLKETTRNANVRAQTYCDLYKLKKEDFLRIIESFPELLENMQKVTRRRSDD